MLAVNRSLTNAMIRAELGKNSLTARSNKKPKLAQLLGTKGEQDLIKKDYRLRKNLSCQEIPTQYTTRDIAMLDKQIDFLLYSNMLHNTNIQKLS